MITMGAELQAVVPTPPNTNKLIDGGGGADIR